MRGKAVVMGGRKESVRTVCWIEHWHAPWHARRRLASKRQNAAEARHREAVKDLPCREQAQVFFGDFYQVCESAYQYMYPSPAEFLLSYMYCLKVNGV